MTSDMDNPEGIDVTVLAFAQWLSEMKARSGGNFQQLHAEMGIIRNGITSNNTDLTEFKRNTATIQQQMQSQMQDLREKVSDLFSEISEMKQSKAQFEQEMQAEYQSLGEQLQFKTVELETLKKAYAQTHQQLQAQIIQLQSDPNELRLRSEEQHRVNGMVNEQNLNKNHEVENLAQNAANELKRLRSDHDQAISNLADNMNKWNDTIRDLSREFHEFQKLMTTQQSKLQQNIYEVSGKQAADTPQRQSGVRQSLLQANMPPMQQPQLMHNKLGMTAHQMVGVKRF